MPKETDTATTTYDFNKDSGCVIVREPDGFERELSVPHFIIANCALGIPNADEMTDALREALEAQQPTFV